MVLVEFYNYMAHEGPSCALRRTLGMGRDRPEWWTESSVRAGTP